MARSYVVTVSNKSFGPFGGKARENGDDYQLVVEARSHQHAIQKARAAWKPRFLGQPSPTIRAILK